MAGRAHSVDVIAGRRHAGANVELGDVVTVKREPACYPVFRRDGRFAEMIQPRWPAASRGADLRMLAVEEQIARLDWGEAGPSAAHYHGQPGDESRPSLLWDGE